MKGGPVGVVEPYTAMEVKITGKTGWISKDAIRTGMEQFLVSVNGMQ